MIIPRGFASGFPILLSSGLDPLSFLVGIVFLIFILLVPRLSHGPFFAPAGISAAPVSSGAIYSKKRSSREIRGDMTVNKKISGIEFDFLTQNVYQAIQNHMAANEAVDCGWHILGTARMLNFIQRKDRE